jgi:hypothetical protein
MVHLKNVNNGENEISHNWFPAAKYDSESSIDEKGNKVSSNYNGHQYRIIEKIEPAFSGLERFRRGLLGRVAVICTLCLGLLKSVRNLFTKFKENIRVAVDDERSSDLAKKAKNIAVTKIQRLYRGHLARLAFKKLRKEHGIQEETRKATSEKEARKREEKLKNTEDPKAKKKSSSSAFSDVEVEKEKLKEKSIETLRLIFTLLVIRARREKCLSSQVKK